MLSVQLPEGLEKRLHQVCKEIHHTPQYCIKKALEAWLEDREDYLLAVTAYEDYLKDGKKTVPIEKIRKRLGLTDHE